MLITQYLKRGHVAKAAFPKRGGSGFVDCSDRALLRYSVLMVLQVIWIIHVETSITLINRTAFNMNSCAQFTIALEIARSVSLNLLQVRVWTSCSVRKQLLIPRP